MRAAPSEPAELPQFLRSLRVPEHDGVHVVDICLTGAIPHEGLLDTVDELRQSALVILGDSRPRRALLSFRGGP